MLTLPSDEIIIGKDQHRICFTLPASEDGQSRSMIFGDDFNTRIFRVFASFMMRYKMYAEFV